MVRVPGSSGDSGVHGESLGEDIKIKTESGIEASEVEGSPQAREMKGSPKYQSFGRGSENTKVKKEDRSLYLEDKPRPPSEVPSGSKADRAAKHDSQGGNRMVKNEQYSSKNTLYILKKKVSKVARTKKESSEREQRDRAVKGEYGPIKFLEEEETADGWQLDRLTEEYHWKILKTLLSSNPVHKILKPKLIGKIKSLISLSSSNGIEHAGRDLRNRPATTGGRVRRGGVQREEITGL